MKLLGQQSPEQHIFIKLWDNNPQTNIYLWSFWDNNSKTNID
jgi:hypothetical protein